MAATISVLLIGEYIHLRGVFKTNTGTDDAPVWTNADPTTVTCTVRAPGGTVTTYTTATSPAVVKDSTGNYHLDLLLATAGDYKYKWVGTGTVADTQDGAFYVRADPTTTAGPIPNALTTLGETRRYVLRDGTDGSQDEQLIDLINAYSSAVVAYTRREWLPQTNGASRRFQYTGGGFLSLEPYELRNLTSITMYTDLPTASQRVLVAGSPSVQGEYRLHPANRSDEGTYQWITLPQSAYGVSGWGAPSYYNNPYPYGPVGRAAPLDFEVTVTGDWGVGTVPYDVNLAVRIAIKDAYENPTGYASGVEGGLSFQEPADAQIGSEARARNLPIEARALLTPYKRGSQVVTA